MTLMDCGIVNAIYPILRYCYDEGVDLRERDYLDGLRSPERFVLDSQNRGFMESCFRNPLGSDRGAVRCVGGKLVISSSPSNGVFDGVSFSREDIGEMLEGVIRVHLDCDGVRCVQYRCMDAVENYFGFFGV